MLEAPQALARLDPELLGEHATSRLVGARRGRPLRAVQGQHELGSRPFSQRMFGDERLQLDDELVVASELEIGFDPLLLGCEAELVEARDLRLREVRVSELRPGRAAPQAKRLSQLLGSLFGLARARARRAPSSASRKTAASSSPLSRRRRYPGPWVSSASPDEPNVARSRETSACSVLSADGGGVSPQRPSTSLSADRISLALISRIARSSRCFPRGISTCVPPTTISRGPRILASIGLLARGAADYRRSAAVVQPARREGADDRPHEAVDDGRRRMKRFACLAALAASLVLAAGTGAGDRPPHNPMTGPRTDRVLYRRTSRRHRSPGRPGYARTGRSSSNSAATLPRPPDLKAATSFARTIERRTDQARSNSSRCRERGRFPSSRRAGRDRARRRIRLARRRHRRRSRVRSRPGRRGQRRVRAPPHPRAGVLVAGVANRQHVRHAPTARGRRGEGQWCQARPRRSHSRRGSVAGPIPANAGSEGPQRRK